MGRSPCCDKNGLKKGPWTTEEDQKLTSYIEVHGPGNWRTLPKNAGLQRCGKSCRLRWTNYLRPDIRRGRFSFEEEETIIQLHSILGNKWSAIAARLPGRTDNEIKNYWNTHIRKRLLRNGIDPVTHAPRLDLLDLSALLSQVTPAASLLGLLNPELLRLAAALGSLKQDTQAQQQILMSQALTAPPPQTTPSQLVHQHHPAADVAGFPELNNHFSSSDNNSSSAGSHQEESLVSVPDEFGFWNAIPELADNCQSFQSGVNVTNNNNNYYYGAHLSGAGGNVGNVDSSVMSTPLSSPAQVAPLSGSTTEDVEREISSLLKFEIPHGLDLLDDFM